MRSLETPWEKRNLGVHGIEFYFDKNDKKIKSSILNESEHEYQVAYIPVNNMEIVWQLEKAGFQFFETRFELKADLKKMNIQSAFSRYTEGLNYHKVISSEDVGFISEKIKSGIFDTDKVAIDPKLGVALSGNRYDLWLKDEIKQKRCELYMVEKREKIGFFTVRKNSENISESFLAALFDKNKNSGYGFSVLYYPLLAASNLGYRKMVTGVSANNPDSLKLHIALGYQIKGMQYVMIKHL